MYVEEVILQGFKTYMNRTVISNFDPQFNAITGLNGSGKSNILDAIQFLLGSTSKEMLRLKTGLTELIYKEGFAGIQKASVTIKFRCIDKNMRPTGYQNCQELIITRQVTKDKISKFFINGQNSNLTKLKNLFRSVQLNIENPHFLVKQGQITKIINLKPLQLLAMIEQTAGTAFYNKTRIDSQRTIEKKQQKLQSINQILETAIKPQMQKLQIDRKKYAVFKDKQVLAERLNHKIKKHEYAVKMLETRNKQYKMSSYKQTMERKVTQLRNLSERLINLQSQIQLLKSQGINKKALEDYNHMRTLILERENKRKTIKNRLHLIQKQSLILKQQNIKSEQEMQRLKQQIQWSEKEIMQTQKQIDETGDLLNELNKSKSEQETAKLIEKQIKQEYSVINNLKEDIKMLQGKKGSIKRQMENQNKSMQETKQSMDGIKTTIKNLQRAIEEFRKLQKPIPVQDPQIGSQELKKLENQRRRLINQNHRLAFHFNDPYAGFNRNLVKGKVFMIFKAKERNHQKALEIGAGGKIHNIVIQDQKASQALVKAESFGPMATLIPNNKIRFTTIRPEILKFADQVAKRNGGLAKVAHQLIDYSGEIKNSILFVFGNFMICSSMQIAKAIAYNSNRSLQCKCVTYEGDVYEPGTLTGGFDSNQQFVLSKYHQVRNLDEKIREQRGAFDKKNKDYQQYNSRLNNYKLMEKQYEGNIARKEKLEQKISALSVNAKPRDYSEQLSDIEKRLQVLQKQLSDHEAKVKDLGSKARNVSGKSREQQKKNVQKDLKLYDRKLQEAKKKISLNQIEIQRLNNSIKTADSTEREYEKEIIDLQREQSSVSNQLNENKSQLQLLQSKKLQYEKEITLNQNQINILSSEADQIKKKQERHQEEMKQMDEEMETIAKEVRNNQRILASILLENDWLQNQKTFQIEDGFNYDDSLKEYNQIVIDIDKLKKTVKVNVDDHSYQKLNEQYKTLLEKKGILLNDKQMLLRNMNELDEKRTKTLEICFKVVKEKLSQIFNDLLPGATAHLTLINQNDVTEGAELRVHFNSVKKELSQLSGGQRSLLALSFILALLLYKPSPFYILDQIDSALDLSHTQNIGYMISKRFPQSQFILISLKEGMFQNANVLYKVHFAQGQSKVDRQVLKKKK